MNSQAETQQVWPDDIEMGDRLEFNGDEFEVVGTGPAEATLETTGEKGIELKIFRWAISDDVGIKATTTVSQDEFGDLLSGRGDCDE